MSQGPHATFKKIRKVHETTLKKNSELRARFYLFFQNNILSISNWDFMLVFHTFVKIY